MVTVDINAKRIGPSTDIFVTRPGPNYAFFELFVENNFVGPDLPSLDLPKFEVIEDIENLVAHVARAASIRRWYQSGKRDGVLESRSLKDYEGRRFGRSISQLTRITRAYFNGMKRGDLVIVPPRSFRGRAEIGELVAEPNTVYSINIPLYENDELQGRRALWLASIEKSDLPASTLDALQKPSALFLLPLDFKSQIFRRAYGLYYSDEEYSVRFEVRSEKFRTIDDIYIQGFFNFVTVNDLRLRDGNKEMLSFGDGALANTGTLGPDLFTNVNSPGGLSLKSPLEIPLIIAALLALATIVGPDAYALAQDGSLGIANSQVGGAVDDPCVATVNEQVISQLRLLGYDKWKTACEFAQQAAESTGIESGVKVTDGT